MVKKAYSPTGVPIVGTAEEIECMAYAKVTWDEDTKEVEIDYDGETKFYWDTQVTVMDETGENRLFQDAEGSRWWERELVFKEET